MKIKEGVKLAGLRTEMVLALVIAAQVYHDIADTEMVVTEATGGVHGRGSLHYTGQAADLRTNTMSKELAAKVVLAIREKLGENYDVVLEADHIHVEFQPK